MAYDAAKAIVEGLRLSHAKTSDDLRKELSKANFCVDGAVGPISFDNSGDRKAPEKIVQIVQVQKIRESPPTYDFIPQTNLSKRYQESCKYNAQKK
jgi:ABC-type branched-subunit amino acid transport system substrate-binding protein